LERHAIHAGRHLARAPLQGPAARHQAVAVCLPEAAARLGRERGYLDGGDCPGQAET